jgi:hypothetical protein
MEKGRAFSRIFAHGRNKNRILGLKMKVGWPERAIGTQVSREFFARTRTLGAAPQRR